MNYLGIDLGGTNIAAAVVTQSGSIIGRASLPTPRSAGPAGRHIPEAAHAAVATRMAEAAHAAAEAAGVSLKEVAYVGVGSPGTIRPDTGVVKYWSNLNFNNVPLADMLSAQLGRPVLLENDANAAVLGEFAAGAGRGSASMVAITLGTGVGGGAVLDGRLYTGFNYAGMEVGHFVIEHGGRPCTCGRRGCFEAYCSATALIKRTRELMQQHPESLLWKLAQGSLERVDGRTPFDGAARGDPTGLQVIGEYVSYLGCGVTSLVNIFQPEVFCIGGGPSAQGENIMGPVREILQREDYARNQPRRTRLVRATLGNDAGIIGAALLSKFR